MKSDFRKIGKIRGENTKLKNQRQEKSNLRTSGPTPVARGGCRAKAPPLAARPKQRSAAGRLGSGFISVCLETRWLGQKSSFYVPQRYCKTWNPPRMEVETL